MRKGTRAATSSEHPPLVHDAAASIQVKWDDSQHGAIEAPQGARLLVCAGPGTSKTAVACMRVAHLIASDGLDPGAIWLVSFTRTAIVEIRDRIAGHLEDAEYAYGFFNGLLAD